MLGLTMVADGSEKEEENVKQRLTNKFNLVTDSIKLGIKVIIKS